MSFYLGNMRLCHSVPLCLCSMEDGRPRDGLCVVVFEDCGKLLWVLLSDYL